MRKRTPQVLVKEAKYQGKYVAFGPDGNKIIASGSDLCNVVNKARSKGVKVPAIVFVPKEGVTHIY